MEFDSVAWVHDSALIEGSSIGGDIVAIGSLRAGEISDVSDFADSLAGEVQSMLGVIDEIEEEPYSALDELDAAFVELLIEAGATDWCAPWKLGQS